MTPAAQEESFEVYTRVALTRIEGVLDGIDAKLDALTKTDSDHEKRIREIETWKWKLAGFTAAASMAASGAISAVVTIAVGG